MASRLLQLRASFSRLSKWSIPGIRKAYVNYTICSYLSQRSQENPTAKSNFQPLPREELVTKFKSRLKDRPFTAGSTGEGFREFLAEPRESFPHGVQVINPHQSSLAELTAKCMEYVEESHAQHPAILFRGLPAKTAQDFSTIAKGIPWKGMTYEGEASFRQKVDKSVGTYTANDDLGDVTIDAHNEMAYTKVYPSKVSSLIKSGAYPCFFKGWGGGWIGLTVPKQGFSPDFYVVFATCCRLFAQNVAYKGGGGGGHGHPKTPLATPMKA